jgi:hypothetical protein
MCNLGFYALELTNFCSVKDSVSVFSIITAMNYVFEISRKTFVSLRGNVLSEPLSLICKIRIIMPTM